MLPAILVASVRRLAYVYNSNVLTFVEVPRTQPGFSDPMMTYLVPSFGTEFLSTDPMCKSTQTQDGQTTEQFPLLSAPGGSRIILRYQENGHITLPWNQLGKLTSGTVSVYATNQPDPNDMFTAIHGVWTSDGTGGDGRGYLIAQESFDDGKCYQVNSSPISIARQEQFTHPMPDPLQGNNLWCATNVTLNDKNQQPLPAESMITLYWVWDWPTTGGIDPNLPNGKQETYTTCMDITIT